MDKTERFIKLIGAQAKSGANFYYEDRVNNEIRIPKEHLEKVVCARVKTFLNDSGVLRSVLQRNCGQSDERANEIEKQLKAVTAKIEDCERAQQNISGQLRAAAISGRSDLISTAKFLGEENEKIERDLAQLTSDKERLRHELHIVVDLMKEGKVGEMLARAMKDFDQRCDLEKRQIIQAIIPRIVVHDDKLELFFNFVGQAPEGRRKPGGKKFDLVQNG